jgi:hypothetical protein
VRTRWAGLVALAGLAWTACGAGDGRTGPDGSIAGDGPSVALPQAEASPRQDVPSALRDRDDPRLPPPLVDLAEIRSGGPPPDGIPAIDRPRFQRASDVSWLRDREAVLALEVDGAARAYPVQILTWHEIVNDTVAGTPVAVTYCPLCNSAVAYDRRLGDRVLDFGTSGSLYRSALVMYDRQTESLWAHFLGQAVAGVLTGAELATFPVATVSWADFRRAHPEAWVLSRDTGHSRSYGTNPYPGYDDVGTSPFLFQGRVDGRLAAKERVVGIRRDGEAAAVVLEELAGRRVLELTLAGRALTVWFTPGTASALDAASVAEGRDVGATGVFEPVVDGQRLTFRPAGDGAFEDAETASRWDILGRAGAGPLAGRRLAAVEHVDTFWFAWAAYLPDTRLVP